MDMYFLRFLDAAKKCKAIALEQSRLSPNKLDTKATLTYFQNFSKKLNNVAKQLKDTKVKVSKANMLSKPFQHSICAGFNAIENIVAALEPRIIWNNRENILKRKSLDLIVCSPRNSSIIEIKSRDFAQISAAALQFRLCQLYADKIIGTNGDSSLCSEKCEKRTEYIILLYDAVSQESAFNDFKLAMMPFPELRELVRFQALFPANEITCYPKLYDNVLSFYKSRLSWLLL